MVCAAIYEMEVCGDGDPYYELLGYDAGGRWVYGECDLSGDEVRLEIERLRPTRVIVDGVGPFEK